MFRVVFSKKWNCQLGMEPTNGNVLIGCRINLLAKLVDSATEPPLFVSSAANRTAVVSSQSSQVVRVADSQLVWSSGTGNKHTAASAAGNPSTSGPINKCVCV